MAKLTPALSDIPSKQELINLKKSQNIAFQCAQETAAEIRPGWTEKKTAGFIRNWLADNGVTDYFHRPLVFFGTRTRYESFKHLKDLAPTSKQLQESDVFILDFGPIIDGVACDISITKQIGFVQGYAEAEALLNEVRNCLPQLIASKHRDGVAVWREITDLIRQSGFDPIHQTSDYSFFGHRLNGTKNFPLAEALAKRGKQTYAEFFARGLSGQLWSGIRESAIDGLWAVEPHIGADGFGVKFEETLVVSSNYIGWLKDLPLSSFPESATGKSRFGEQ